jgi:hypothetical protein
MFETVWSGPVKKMAKQQAHLERPINSAPDFVKMALATRGLTLAYKDRPPYQRNDYIGWITRAKREETQIKRLNQMLDELERGDSYMKMPYHASQKRETLRSIPGVGPRIAEDLTSIGVRAVADLKGKDPDKLYHKLCRRVGKPVDRCMLYVFRCAVYFASNRDHNPELLKWWNWKDRK